MKNLKDRLLTILLIIMIGIPALLGILSIFGVLSNVFSTIGNVFLALSSGSWLRGVTYTLFVIVGLINLIRGVFVSSPRVDNFLESLPKWAAQLIVGTSFIGSLGFIFVFFSLIV